MSNEPKLTPFKSRVTRDFFGLGMRLETVTREEKQLYLSKVGGLVRKKCWLGLVVDSYLGEIGLDMEFVVQMMGEIWADIHAIQHSMINKEVLNEHTA